MKLRSVLYIGIVNNLVWKLLALLSPVNRPGAGCWRTGEELRDAAELASVARVRRIQIELSKLQNRTIHAPCVQPPTLTRGSNVGACDILDDWRELM